MCLLCVRDRRLLQKNMLSCFECSERPFIVEAVGEGVVYTVNGCIVDERYNGSV